MVHGMRPDFEAPVHKARDILATQVLKAVRVFFGIVLEYPIRPDESGGNENGGGQSRGMQQRRRFGGNIPITIIKVDSHRAGRQILPASNLFHEFSGTNDVVILSQDSQMFGEYARTGGQPVLRHIVDTMVQNDSGPSVRPPRPPPHQAVHAGVEQAQVQRGLQDYPNVARASAPVGGAGSQFEFLLTSWL